jgi:exodeoxyribonuclease-1
MPYVFYDTETTGTETAFDQILQFAAIKTDDDLNELDRFNTRCRLLPHVVPSPEALRVTHVTPARLTDPALPSHYEMMQHIRENLLQWSPATFVGFNSLQFDENLLRQALFQTLHPAYLTNTNGNARSNALRVPPPAGDRSKWQIFASGSRWTTPTGKAQAAHSTAHNWCPLTYSCP